MAVSLFLAVAGCDKERIVETTEYVRDIEYVEVPADTVFKVDSIFINDSDTISSFDTVFVFDTIFDNNTIFDTVFVTDTVTTVEHHYDTTVVTDTDTVTVSQCTPNEFLAYSALQYYSDDLVLEAINAEFGISEGYIFYTSAYQINLSKASANVYDIYGLIDYWTTDFTGFYAFEFYWRMSCTGGDPADPDNWDMSEPPDLATSHQPGIRLIQSPAIDLPARR